VWSEDGLIVTAHHTIERRSEVRIGAAGGEAVEARILGRDPATDLAVLRLPRTLGRPLPLAEADQLRVGHLALAVGRPGDDLQATMGILSAIDGAWRTPFGGQLDHFLQSDVVMYPGFSGGALVDAWGRLVGMNTSALLRGVAMAVPVGTIRRVAQMLVEHGRVRRGHLGVGVQPAHLPKAIEPEGATSGLLVASVEPGSPAEKGGLLLGDVLLTLGGQPVSTMDELLTTLSGDVVGKTVTIDLVRGGARRSVSVTVGERPEPSEED
jgi:S1-C subfamily serine protease